MPIQQLAPKSPGRNPISSDPGPIPLEMSPSPPPQRGCYSPPALVDDAMREIFKRVPPDDPKSLVRAAAVCTSWHGILSDADFTREYRAFHGAPPMLGFLLNTCHDKLLGKRASIIHEDKKYLVSSFVSTASFRPPACHDRRHWRVLDSRHGLVLFHTPKSNEDFVVCDIVTYERWRIKADPHCGRIIRSVRYDEYGDEYQEEEEEEDITWDAAVLCAKVGCDHIYCHGGPFLVALVGSDDRRMTFATFYSSKTRKWSDMISIQEPNAIEVMGHSAVVGNKVYFQCKYRDRIMEYSMVEQTLSVIELVQEEDEYLTKLHLMGLEEEDWPPELDLMGVEDGMLLFAVVLEPTLYLWSMEVGPNGAVAWAHLRVIQLEPLLPSDALFDMSVVGFAEGVGVIFVSTQAGLYTIELSSGRSKKVLGRTSIRKIMPYMSFYTRAWGSMPISY